jgi:hypothetical protein
MVVGRRRTMSSRSSTVGRGGSDGRLTPTCVACSRGRRRRGHGGDLTRFADTFAVLAADDVTRSTWGR